MTRPCLLGFFNQLECTLQRSEHRRTAFADQKQLWGQPRDKGRLSRRPNGTLHSAATVCEGPLSAEELRDEPTEVEGGATGNRSFERGNGRGVRRSSPLCILRCRSI